MRGRCRGYGAARDPPTLLGDVEGMKQTSAPVSGMTKGKGMDVATELALIGRVGIAFVLSFILGFERQLRRAPAGDRTYALVGTASAAVTAVCFVQSPQSVAGVLTGIGFIGAGMVFRDREGSITGITSAATLLGVVAVGIAAGAGYLSLAVVLAAIMLVNLEIRYVPGLRVLDGRRYTNKEDEGG